MRVRRTLWSRVLNTKPTKRLGFATVIEYEIGQEVGHHNSGVKIVPPLYEFDELARELDVGADTEFMYAVEMAKLVWDKLRQWLNSYRFVDWEVLNVTVSTPREVVSYEVVE